MAQGNGGIIGKLNTPTADAAGGVWTMRDMELAQQAGKWPATAYQYQIARSLRFNSADSAFLDRTPASSGNRKTWTWSGWVKKTVVGDGRYPALFGAVSGTRDVLRFNGESLNLFFNNATSANLVTTSVYRDVSAWYHVVLAVDTTQATDTNRVKLYVNGVQITSFSTASYPAQNYDTFVNMNAVQRIGNDSNLSDGYYNGYMADVRFIDGQALTAASFGEFNTDTGVWQPKTYAGTYGTNGFWLKFADNSNTTAATLGADSSGNGNNWTPNNFSVTAGAGNDSLVDSPTSYGTDTGDGGNVRGNYATLNPLTFTGGSTATNGNLDGAIASGDTSYLLGSIAVSSGKWYWEWTPTSNLIYTMAGVAKADAANKGWGSSTTFAYWQNGTKYTGGVGASYGASFVLNDTIGVALDMDAGTVTFYKNGVSQGTAFSGLYGTYTPSFSNAGTGTVGYFSVNFGQRPFAYAAPSGFKALCTQNLPTPAVGATAGNRGGNHFNAIAYTGDGVVPRALTGFGFSPDLLWSTRRDVSYGIQIFDSVRGAGKRLNTGYSGLSTAAEDSGYGLVNSFDADGYTSTTVDGGSNNSGGSYLTWGWNAGESTVSNTNGSITSSVRANPTAGISVLTYTGNGTVGSTVGHGLGATLGLYIVRGRNAVDDWYVYHQSYGAYNAFFLNLPNAYNQSSNFWNNTSPTSSVFSVAANTNVSTRTYVAYCFSEVAGFSKFGSYVGNGSADGPFVYCGFRPRWIMVKSAVNATWPWWVVDTVRGTVNPLSYYITTNTSNPETNNFSGYVICDALSNGFKIRSSDAYGNTNADTYIFAAFAEFPFKYSLAR